jgi:ABC-type nitrate/sulfonate/bicarbonate transport system substrate-binding protein
MRTVTYLIGCQCHGDRSIAHWISGFLALIILIFAGPARAQVREDKMLVSYGGVGGYQLPLWFGAETRIFDRYGVQARPVFIPSAANSMKALLSGDTQAAQTSGSAAINGILNGADLVIIAAPYNLLPYNFYAGKGISRPEDLRGKKVGILNFGGVTEYVMMMLLRKWGLDPRRDVTVIQIGNDPTRLAALAAGSIQGTVLTHPAMNKAESLGFKSLANLTEMGIKYPTNTVTVRRSWLKDNRVTAEKFLKGYVASIHAMKNREQDAIKVLAKYTKIEERDSLVKTARYYSAGIPLDPRIDSKAIEAVLATFEKTIPGASQRAPGEFFDSGPLEAVERSGFIQEISR